MAFLCLSAPVPAVDLRIQFGALERMLTEQVFTQEGRRYVGKRNTKCNFAYLEKPRVEGYAGRLVIHTRFSGRSAANLLGQCVGLGDAFDLTITATPQYHDDGNIGLKDVVVASDGKTGFYIRQVCAVMKTNLGRDLRLSIKPAARKLLEDPGGPNAYQRELRNFNVTEIRVTGDALVLVLDFELTVR